MWTIVKYYIISFRPWIALLIATLLSYFDNNENPTEYEYPFFSVLTMYYYFYVSVSTKKRNGVKAITPNLPLSDLQIWVAKSLSFVLLLFSHIVVVLILDNMVYEGVLNIPEHFLMDGIYGYLFACVISRYQIIKSRNLKKLINSILITVAMLVSFFVSLALCIAFYYENRIELLSLFTYVSMFLPFLVLNSFDYITKRMIR